MINQIAPCLHGGINDSIKALGKGGKPACAPGDVDGAVYNGDILETEEGVAIGKHECNEGCCLHLAQPVNQHSFTLSNATHLKKTFYKHKHNFPSQMHIVVATR